MKDIHGLTAENFLSAFPIVLREDAGVSALGEAAAEVLERRAGETGLARIYPNIMSLPEDLLDILAYDFKVDWWNPDYTLEEKRRVLRDSWYVHRRMGTRAAVETALKAVYRDAVILEWFEYGGKPGYFRLWTDVTNEDFVPALRREILRRMDYYKRLSAHLESVGYWMKAEPSQAWAYLAYGGQTQKRWGGIKAPPSVGPPEARGGLLYGGVLAGMAGEAERNVEVPPSVMPPGCKPSLVAAHYLYAGQIQKRWNGIVSPPGVKPPETRSAVKYGGAVAGMAGETEQTVEVPPEVRPAASKASVAAVNFSYVDQIQKRWGKIVPPPTAASPKAKAKAAYGSIRAGMAGSAEREVRIRAKAGPPVCRQPITAICVAHAAVLGGVQAGGNLQTEPPKAGASAVYGGTPAGVAGSLRAPGIDLENGNQMSNEKELAHMAHWSESAVTNVGVTMLNEYMAGRRLTITAAYGGSGLVDEDKLVEQTGLLEQRQTLNIVEVADAESGKTLTIQVHNKGLAEEYSLSQIGVYAKLDGEDEDEKLLFVTQDRSPVLIPSESEESFVFELYYNVGITNTGRFHVTIDAAGVVTLERLRREMGAPGGIATLDENGILSEAQRPDLSPIQNQIDALREELAEETQGELQEVTLTNTLSSSPFNSTMDSPETVALAQTRNNLFYSVETEIKAHNGQVGEIIISDKALNGFKIAYTGSGASVTLTVRIKGGMT